MFGNTFLGIFFFSHNFPYFLDNLPYIFVIQWLYQEEVIAESIDKYSQNVLY